MSTRFQPDSYKPRHLRSAALASNSVFQALGNIHDIDSGLHKNSTWPLNFSTLFASHWGHLSLIAFWSASISFHVGWQGNYESWLLNPVKEVGVSHQVWDPHFGVASILNLGLDLGRSTPANLSFSGSYFWFKYAGVETTHQLFVMAIVLEFVSIGLLLMSLFSRINLDLLVVNICETVGPGDYKLWAPFILNVYDFSNARFLGHLGVLLGLSSIAWSGHLIHVTLPSSRGSSNSSLLHSLRDLMSGAWSSLLGSDTPQHIFGASTGAGSGILSFSLQLTDDLSLPVTDVIHHHLSIGILFLYLSYLARLIRRAGVVVSSYDVGQQSTHLILAQTLFILGACSSITGQLGVDLPAYPFLCFDLVTSSCLFIHHQYIAGFLTLGSFTHLGIYLVRDYEEGEVAVKFISRVLKHKAALVSHLSWVSLFLGFHTLGIYVHNDVVTAFSDKPKAIILDPLFQGLGPGDLLASHAVSLGLHVTTLILLKGGLDSRSSSLMPDKSSFGYGFPCDGPGRGGSCDISAWDSVYLASLWMLNTVSWLSFWFQFKLISAASSSGVFESSSLFLNGWFKDYLWLNSGSLISGYQDFGITDLSVWSWVFIGAHFVWALSFMFLISWRGYWQELIDTLVLMHLRTPVLSDLWEIRSFTPVALSIVQARFIGLAHFTVGLILTYSSFAIGACS